MTAGTSASFVRHRNERNPFTVGLLGFGEVGQALAADLLARFTGNAAGAIRLLTWDLLFTRPDSGPATAAARLPELHHQAVDSAAELARRSDLVISAVTAANDLHAAESACTAIHGTWFVDLNSASPATKEQASRLVDAAGGRYVEAAVMSPIEPRRLDSPMLLGGKHAAGLATLLAELGFGSAQVFSDRIGAASATKMCRSVVIKGMEALLAESLLSARHYGVQAEVLQSLGNLLPHDNWPQLARYMISRSVEHGVRRAEEMTEASRTVSDAGVTPLMTDACVARQQWAALHGDVLATTAGDDGLNTLLDALLQHGPAIHPVKTS